MIYGVGLNDVGKVTDPVTKKKCKIYTMWLDMLRRCYSETYQNQHVKYKGCSVEPGWFKFSSFKDWVLSNKEYAENKQLDKDLLVKGNKLYSPETCTFISQEINKFLTVNQTKKSGLPVGVNKKSNRFQAVCNNPFTKKLEHLGYFSSAEEAHLAWKTKKQEIAKIYADQENNEEIKQALIEYFK